MLPPEIHQGLVPSARVVRVEPGGGRILQRGRRGLGRLRTEQGTAHDPPDVRVHSRSREAEGLRGDGGGRVGADPGERPELARVLGKENCR